MSPDHLRPDPAPMPTRITIGTVTYTVTIDPDDWMRIEHNSRKFDDYAHTKHNIATIYLNPDQAPSVLPLTLWHEVLHALAETCMGAPDWRGLGKDKDDREESVIRAWEHPTLAVLRDNPQLVAYLTSQEGEQK